MELGRQLVLKEIRLKAAKFCAFQERCSAEVTAKLQSLGCTIEDIDDTIAWLESEKYLDDRRYATAYARGKFRHNQWGKIKIRHHLQLKGISTAHIDFACARIDEAEYLDMIQALVAKKITTVGEGDPYTKNHKVAQFVIGKGFDPDLVWSVIKKEQ